MTNVLIVNQHGDNRGDEAALRGCIDGLDSRLPDAEFVVFHQFFSPASKIDPGVPVEYFPLKLPIVEAARFALAATLHRFGLRWARALAGPTGRRMIDAYDQADLVLSAPGGPYFGDLYAGHEIVHWFYAWLGSGRGTPLVLAAPSAGPFRHRLLNPIRRRGFRMFDRVIVREERSAEMLRCFMPGLDVEVTADAALQQQVSADDHPITDAVDPADVATVVVAVRDPGDDRRDVHDRAVVAAVNDLARRVPVSVHFLPQLHGPRHQDMPYLQGLADRIDAASVTVVSDEVSSVAHRALIAAADLVVAGRYHPAVFSVSSATPVVVLPYEHKAHGLAEAAGIGRWTRDVADIDGPTLVDLVNDAWDHRDEQRAILSSTGPDLAYLSARTSEMAARTVAS